MAGVKDQGYILGVTSVVGFIKIGIILTARFIMDKIGRQPLLLVSVAGMILSLAGLGFGLTIFCHSDEKLIWAVDMGVAMAFLCAAFFSAGLVPITWVYSSEVLPLRLRAQGASLGAAVNLDTRGLTSLAFISSHGVSLLEGRFCCSREWHQWRGCFFISCYLKHMGNPLRRRKSDVVVLLVHQMMKNHPSLTDAWQDQNG
ncbi:PREDICTED: polyol transporter 5-like [Theobroma cacao]|uniref:Polyol transporter 5-like n=1 Tax=Theobroma cacao TaxID=3641 RepID=A0AB32WJE1_THECC|nr:PREDICTED: polyol transporter 5-like [Theobroma cacao]